MKILYGGIVTRSVYWLDGKRTLYFKVFSYDCIKCNEV